MGSFLGCAPNAAERVPLSANTRHVRDSDGLAKRIATREEIIYTSPVEPRWRQNYWKSAGPRANAGHDTRSLQAYLGHKNIQHTVRYTELAPDRFKDFWR